MSIAILKYARSTNRLAWIHFTLGSPRKPDGHVQVQPPELFGALSAPGPHGFGSHGSGASTQI